MRVSFINAAKQIFLNTLPKSGSVYIWYELHQMLKYPQARFSVTQGTFPVDLIDPERVQSIKHLNCIAQAHVSPSYKNLVMLEHFGLNKIVIHLRDPRQAILSWTHHVDKLLETDERQVLKVIEPRIPENYFEKSLEEKIDFQLETMFPIFVKWIQDWLHAYDVEGVKAPEILFTSFEKFKFDSSAYFNEIFELYEVDFRLQPNEHDATPNDQLHYRQGKTDEWRTVFTPAQIKKANHHLSQYIWGDLSHLHLHLTDETADLLKHP